MDQDQVTLPPTAMEWDANGELCSEDLQRLLDRLEAQEGGRPALTGHTIGANKHHAARRSNPRLANHSW